MAESYVKVKKEEAKIPDNEIRVTKGNKRDRGDRRNQRDGIGKYLNRAHELFSGKEDTIVIKGVKDAIEKAIQLAELIRHRFKGLYQVITISQTTFIDKYEPLEEGLDILEFERHEPSVEIVLSKN